MRPVGWRNHSREHSLAAKGYFTKKYMPKSVLSRIPLELRDQAKEEYVRDESMNAKQLAAKYGVPFVRKKSENRQPKRHISGEDRIAILRRIGQDTGQFATSRDLAKFGLHAASYQQEGGLVAANKKAMAVEAEDRIREGKTILELEEEWWLNADPQQQKKFESLAEREGILTPEQEAARKERVKQLLAQRADDLRAERSVDEMRERLGQVNRELDDLEEVIAHPPRGVKMDAATFDELRRERMLLKQTKGQLLDELRHA